MHIDLDGKGLRQCDEDDGEEAIWDGDAPVSCEDPFVRDSVSADAAFVGPFGERREYIAVCFWRLAPAYLCSCACVTPCNVSEFSPTTELEIDWPQLGRRAAADIYLQPWGSCDSRPIDGRATKIRNTG